MSTRDAMATAKTPGGAERGGIEHRGDMPGRSTHHQCCCLGTCCTTAIFDLARAPRREWMSVEPRREEPAATGALTAPAPDDHVLPFANGPPAAHA